jgi:cytochrome c oxidase subunit 2
MATHSSLDAAGPLAMLIERQWWLFFWICALVYALVCVAVVLALCRAHVARSSQPTVVVAATEPRLVRRVGAAVAATVAILVALAAVDFVAARALSAAPVQPLRIKVVGHQWWWEFEYESALPSDRVRTANELRIPLDRPVQLQLTSQDVIHSFWVPGLQGKRDLIPGRTTTLTLQADRAGRFRGQCAEFCGHQHAYMRLLVHALEPHEYARWFDHEKSDARAPVSAIERRGQDVFLASSCPLCHAIQGTPAAAAVGPDLSHVGSRSTIAAGALENTPEHLARWIAEPQAVKPGTLMPATELPAADRTALAAYLWSLQ